MSIFDKFDSLMDVDGLKNDLKQYEKKSKPAATSFVEVPEGNYEVRVSKLELGATGENSRTPGTPKLAVWYDIIAGEYKGQRIFQNQLLNNAFGVHIANNLLNSLGSGVDVCFENFKQYGSVIDSVFNEIDGVAEYELAYGKNAKGFSTFEIVQRFS